MGDLKSHLIARIAQDGPLRLNDYMAECLFHPDHGYYSTRDPLGADGDFTTAPEISQMFGEMMGLSLAQSWIDQGRPDRIALVELGPGRGTLMADILRVARSVPEFLTAAEVHIVEASPALRAKQRGLLGDTPIWHTTVDDLPSALPFFLVANEFFDALPIRQFERRGDFWCERMIGTKDDALVWGLGAPSPQPALAHRLEDTNDGDLVEICPQAGPISERIGARIEEQGGVALFVDYGDWRSLGDTFQALENHTSTDPLVSPGTADLTAHVDFEALARSTPSGHSKLTPQGVFLERLGITQRAQTLAAKLDGDALKSHVAAHRRLTHPHEMGNLFKVLALFPKRAAPPPGCET